jgi:hypothetical protein
LIGPAVNVGTACGPCSATPPCNAAGDGTLLPRLGRAPMTQCLTAATSSASQAPHFPYGALATGHSACRGPCPPVNMRHRRAARQHSPGMTTGQRVDWITDRISRLGIATQPEQGAWSADMTSFGTAHLPGPVFCRSSWSGCASRQPPPSTCLAARSGGVAAFLEPGRPYSVIVALDFGGLPRPVPAGGSGISARLPSPPVRLNPASPPGRPASRATAAPHPHDVRKTTKRNHAQDTARTQS